MWWMEFSIGMISSQQGHLIHGNNREDLKCILSMFFIKQHISNQTFLRPSDCLCVVLAKMITCKTCQKNNNVNIDYKKTK